MRRLTACLVVACSLLPSLARATPVTKELTLDADVVFQTIDGFGVNVTPAQWRDGNLRKALDLLVDDLGSTLIRLDCVGLATWLDPAARDRAGHWPAAYLRSVYTSKLFRDCWATFRYLKAKKVDVWFNVSGVVPPALSGADGKTLVDHDAYAEMVVSLVEHARKNEHLAFSIFEPLNETDMGPPEGPRIAASDLVPVVQAVLGRLDAVGMHDVKLLLPSDTHVIPERFAALMSSPYLRKRVAAFGSHTYGNGGDQEVSPWFQGDSAEATLVKTIANSVWRGTPVWMTEYGDLDQTGEVEWGVAWRSSRRLLRFLQDGYTAGIAWDAFDNLHLHDNAWATYGLLATDRATWTYKPKRRFHAARQVYRFVRPGYRRVQVRGPVAPAGDVYATWHDPMKHVHMVAFASPDRKTFTLVGMSTVETDVTLDVTLKGITAAGLALPVRTFRTTRDEDCRLVDTVTPASGHVRVVVPENSLFTITNAPAGDPGGPLVDPFGRTRQ